MSTKKEAATAKRKPPRAGMGRPKGSVNKMTKNVREAIHQAFQEAGGVEYLVRVAQDDPKTFCTLIGKVIPQEVVGSFDGNVTLKWED